MALTLACGAVAVLASSGRSWILFYDGDSVLPALVDSSLRARQAQDWIFSPVLFFPELALYLAVAALGLGAHVTALIVGVVNLLAVSLCLRVTVGVVLPHLARPVQVAGSLAGSALLALLICLDRSRSTNDLELASFIATSTYYASTVISMLLVLALVASLSRRSGRRVRAHLVALGALSTFAVFVNPLFVAWSVLPVAAGMALLVLRRRERFARAGRLVGAMFGGTVVGLAARIPFSLLVGGTTTQYLHSRPGKSVRFYVDQVVERASTVPGALSLVLFAGCLVVVGVLLSRGARSGPRTVLHLTVVAAVTVIVTIAWNLTGVNLATRYVQPVVFAPLPVVACGAAMLLDRAHERWGRALPALARVGVVGVLAGSLIGIGFVARNPESLVDESVDCVVRWIDAAGRTGAGTFWTIRPVKAFLADPARLVQVRTTFQPHAWLVNRSDYGVRVSFTVTTAGEKLAVPTILASGAATTISCGRYVITDYAPRSAPVTLTG
jgi:hypothetical protein